MMKYFKIAILLILAVLLPMCAYAQDQYLMTGAARFEKATDSHALPFPVNPITSGVIALNDNSLVFHYEGGSCSVKIERKMSFYFDPVASHAFGSIDNFGRFISGKFHEDYKKIKEIYLLGDTDVPLCSGLRETMIYKSPDALILLGGSWSYAFRRQINPPVNAESSFDCGKAQTNVEHLICNNPDLIKLDATVNRGFVAMQLVNSKEISYQDPIRTNQIDWLKSVRNKCATVPCLVDAYHSRIQFIKDKISSAYPSYPNEEPDQDGD